MSWKNLGSMNMGSAQAVVYSIDGGTNFRWTRLDGVTAQSYDTSYTDPALAIEAAWSWLNTQGGGTLRTRGPGETWIIETTIDSQGDYVTWISDWGLTIKAMNGLNSNMIRLTYNYLVIRGLREDGNKANQAGRVTHPIRIEGANQVIIEQFRMVNGSGHGIYGGSELTVRDGYIDSITSNGISSVTNALIENVEVTGCSDIGIHVGSGQLRTIIQNCRVHDINGEDGSSNSNWGISVEYGGSGKGEVILKNNYLYGDNSKHLVVTALMSELLIDGNVFEECNESAWQPSALEVMDNEDDYSPSNIEICHNQFRTLNGVKAIFVRQFLGHLDIHDNIITYASGETANPSAIEVWGPDSAEGDGTADIHDNQIQLPTTGTSIGIDLDGTNANQSIDDYLVHHNMIKGYGTGIFLSAGCDDVSVEGNLIRVSGTGLVINAASCDRTIVDGNDFYTCGVAVTNNGTNTRFGGNKDVAGNWDENVLP